MRGGIDLGGTKIQAVVVDDTDAVIGSARRETPKQHGPAGVADKMAQALADAAAEAGTEPAALDGVGVGSPGTIDAAAGTVAHARNVVDEWDDPYPLASALADRVGARIAIGNDVNVATEAEYRLGAGKPFRSLLGVFWGTGVGGGLVLDGHRWVGRGAAGEIGHMVVKRDGARCTCGRIGCMEAYAGRLAMEIRAREHVRRGVDTQLFKIMEKRGHDRLSSGVWERALDEGDDLATGLINRALKALGVGIASAVNLLDVEAVIIGGGMGTRFGQPYADRILEQMMPHLFVAERPPEVLVAALGDLGGAIGAALLVRGDQA